MPGDIDPISGKPVSEVSYGSWVMREDVSRVADDPRYVRVQQYKVREVRYKDSGRLIYTQREDVGGSFTRLTGEARREAVERYEYEAAQKSIEEYKKAEATEDIVQKSVHARLGKMYENIGADYLQPSEPVKPDEPSGEVVTITDPKQVMEHRRWLYYGTVPPSAEAEIRQQGIPEDVKTLGLEQQYIKASYGKHYREHYAERYTLQPKYQPEKKWERTYEKAYYEKYPPQQVVAQEKPKRERSVWDLGDWWEDPGGTIASGTADILSGSRFFEDWMVGYTYRKISGVEATKEDLWRANRELWRTRWKQRDILGGTIGVVSSPLGMMGGAYLLGKLMGGFAATKLGQKELFKIGFIEKQIGTGVYKYTIPVTPAKLTQAGITGVFGYKAVEGGVEAYKSDKLGAYIFTMAVTLPLVIKPYKWGYHSGMRWVQRRGEMASVTDGVSRIRQKAGYDLIDETYKLPRTKDYYGDIPYDIKNIKQIGTTQADVFYHMATGKGKMFWTGSGALKAQYRSFFRTGQKPPGSLESYALWRQQKYPSQVGARPILGYGTKGKLELVPKDIDVYFRAKSGIADYWDIVLGETKIKGFDIHTYKAWQLPGLGKKLNIGGGYGKKYIELGIFQMKPVKTTVLLRGEWGVSIIKNIPSIGSKEQFLRMTRNLLPSTSELYGGRTWKDVSTWTDISAITKPTAHAGWIDAYNRFISPELYPSKIPRVTFGEKLISKLGGSAELVFKGDKPISLGYSFLYPESYVPLPLAGAYPITPYKTPTYPTPKYKTLAYPAPRYPTPSYPAHKTPRYKTPVYPTPSYPTLTPPGYPTPGYPTPDIPYYPPPGYPKPDYPEPTTPTPGYPTRKYPTPPPVYSIFPPGGKKQKLPLPFSEREKRLERVEQGYNVWVKDRYMVKGKKKYTERFIKLSKKPLSKHDALSFGSTIVDNSAAASFRISKTGKPAQKLPFPVRNWGLQSNMFYKRNDIFIERTDFRINTPGEIRQISARGWVAERRKLHPKPVKHKPMRVIKRKPMKYIKNDIIKEFRRYEIWGR